MRITYWPECKGDFVIALAIRENNTGMDSVLKRRLIGAAVIIALAVIFVPMLLESPDSDNPVKSEIKIPQKPSYEIPNRLESQVVEDTGKQASSLQQKETAVVTPDSALVNQFPASSTAKTKQIDHTDTQVPTKQNGSNEDTEKKQVKKNPPQERQAPARVVETSTMPVKPVKKPSVEPPRVDGAGFVAQVGSFTQRQNAVVLADKLQASSYPAFVEEAATGTSMVYRVKLGPVVSREAAEKMLEKVKKNESLGGIVLSYP